MEGSNRTQIPIVDEFLTHHLLPIYIILNWAISGKDVERQMGKYADCAEQGASHGDVEIIPLSQTIKL